VARTGVVDKARRLVDSARAAGILVIWARAVFQPGYHAYHVTRADLLRRLGRSQESRAAYDKAIELAGNTAETAYLTRRRDQLR
jgi:predicted RNA polymerase sigma factor